MVSALEIGRLAWKIAWFVVFRSKIRHFRLGSSLYINNNLYLCLLGRNFAQSVSQNKTKYNLSFLFLLQPDTFSIIHGRKLQLNVYYECTGHVKKLGFNHLFLKEIEIVLFEKGMKKSSLPWLMTDYYVYLKNAYQKTKLCENKICGKSRKQQL